MQVNMTKRFDTPECRRFCSVIPRRRPPGQARLVMADDRQEKLPGARQRKTWLGYCLTLRYFTECCSKNFVEHIDLPSI